MYRPRESDLESRAGSSPPSSLQRSRVADPPVAGDYHASVTGLTPRPALPPGLEACGVVAIARRLSPSTATAVADALRSGGVLAFEIALNDPVDMALRAIQAVATRAPDLAIGAGTVLSIQTASQAIDAGATFLVLPHTDPELVSWAAARAIPTLPGAGTSTEVLAGWRAGAAAVKVFPASVLGAAFVRECRGPFPEIPLVPSGGVTAENAGEFVRAGAVAVGIGGWLIGDAGPGGVTARARRAVGAVATARAGTAAASGPVAAV